jgi:hypothetical protein
MAAPSFDDLLTTPSQDDVFNQEVQPELVKRGVRVTDWVIGSAFRTISYVVAKMRANVRVAVATIMTAGFEDYVFGKATPPPDVNGNVSDVTGWAPVISVQRYGTPRIEATYTRRTITLTNTSLSAYGPLQPGTSLMVQFPSGNRYQLDEVKTIAANGVTTAIFRSEFPTNSAAGQVYNDPPGSTLYLVTSNYSGVTPSNPAPTFSPVTHAGTGLGTIAPSGTPTGGAHSVAVRIMSSGVAGGAGWQYSIDGAAWSATQTAASLLIGSGITLTLADNSGNPSFLLGEQYYFTTPGSDIVQVGADVESAPVLGARCRGLIPAIAFAQDSNGRWIPLSPTASGYETLVRNANANVRVVLIQPDGTINNKLNVIIAGNGGAPLSAADVANMQQFLNAFSMTTDFPAVQTSTARAITLAGLTISCKSAQLVAAQATLTQRLQTYLGGVDATVALNINGLVDYDYIIALVRTTPGVTHVSGTLTINAAAADLQLPVTPGAFESATWSQSAATAFTWATAA